jgi:hypothetical protein
MRGCLTGINAAFTAPGGGMVAAVNMVAAGLQMLRQAVIVWQAMPPENPRY